MGDQAHSNLAPSACSRWSNCPGSVRLNENKPNLSSRYAAEGSVAHDLAAKLLKGELKGTKELEALAGDTVMQDDHEIEITEEMVEHVTDYCVMVAEMVQNTYGLDASFHKSNVFIEQEVKINDDIWGTSDFSLYVPFDCIVIGDLKYGAGVPVEVKGNKQLIVYAIGVRNYLIEKFGSIEFDRIVVFIYQPRARHADGPYREWEITVAELEKYEAEIVAAAKATMAKDAPVRSGEWCRWCGAKDDCPALFQDTNELAERAFDIETGDLSPIDEMSLDQVAEIIKIKSRIENFMKACEVRAKQALVDGIEVPGYRLVRGRSSRKWYDAEDMALTLRGEGIKDPYTEQKVVTPAQAEKLLKSDGNMTLKEAKEKLEEYVQVIEGGPAIAPEHDPRQTLSLNPGDGFTVIDDDDKIDYGIFS